MTQPTPDQPETPDQFETPDQPREPASSAAEPAEPSNVTFAPELLEKVARLEKLLAHLWMIRQFLKHCDEAEDDEDLCDVQRELYD